MESRNVIACNIIHIPQAQWYIPPAGFIYIHCSCRVKRKRHSLFFELFSVIIKIFNHYCPMDALIISLRLLL